MSIKPVTTSNWMEHFDSPVSKRWVAEEEPDSGSICHSPPLKSEVPAPLVLPEPMPAPPPITYRPYIEGCKIPFVIPLSDPPKFDPEDGRTLHSTQIFGTEENFILGRGIPRKILNPFAPKDDQEKGGHDPGSDAEVMTQWIGL